MSCGVEFENANLSNSSSFVVAEIATESDQLIDFEILLAERDSSVKWLACWRNATQQFPFRPFFPVSTSFPLERRH